MWEYKVVTGTYSIDGANVIIRNPAGEGTLQQALDIYGADRWEVVTLHLDGVQREAVLVLKRPRGGAAAPVAGAAPAAARSAASPTPSGRTFVDPDGEVVRRRAPGAPPASARGAAPAPAPEAPQAGGRRNRRDLDKLMRDD